MKVNWSMAGAWIDSYLAAITDPNQIPGRFGRTWLECEAARVGLVADWRGWKLLECHSVWYAALVVTGRLHEVNRIEVRLLRLGRGHQTTLKTVRSMLDGRLRTQHGAYMLRNRIDEARAALGK